MKTSRNTVRFNFRLGLDAGGTVMLIKLKDIGEAPSRFNFRLSRSVFLKLEDGLRFKEMNCKARLNKKQDAVLLGGEYKVSLSAECDLCLAPAALDIERRFDLTLIPEDDKLVPKGDLKISLGSSDVEYYAGQEILLDRRFEDQLLLDLPMLIRCSEECRGLCNGCGANLNYDACQCKNYSNNPFYVLSQLDN